MSVHLILVQAIGFFGTILFFLSYQFKSNKTLFRVQFVSYMISLLVLGREYWMKLSAKHPCCCPLFAMDGKI